MKQSSSEIQAMWDSIGKEGQEVIEIIWAYKEELKKKDALIGKLETENKRLVEFLDGRCMGCLDKSLPQNEHNYCSHCVELEALEESESK